MILGKMLGSIRPRTTLGAIVCATLGALLASCIADANADERFRYVLHGDLNASDIAHLERALEAAHQPVISKLGLELLPVITVQIWDDEEEFQEAMAATLGMRAQGSRGYVTGDRELRLLHHTAPSAAREAVHEFVHVATLNLEPDFGNNPRWLWEAVALYLANEFVDPRSTEIMQDQKCPSLQQLDAPFDNGGAIYEAGYLLIQFIETKWGFDKVTELIKSKGDMSSTLGISESEFERQWCAFVVATYPHE